MEYLMKSSFTKIGNIKLFRSLYKLFFSQFAFMISLKYIYLITFVGSFRPSILSLLHLFRTPLIYMCHIW